MHKLTTSRPRNEASAKFQRYEIPFIFAAEFVFLLGMLWSWYVGVPAIILNITHLGGFAFLFGMQLYVTFIAGMVMMKSLPQKEFGRGLSAVLSWYFNLETILTALVLCCYLIKHPYSQWTADDKYQMSWLGVIILTTLASNLYWHQTCVQLTADSKWEEQQREERPYMWRDIPPTPAVPWYKKGYAACRSLANFVSVAGGVVHFMHLSSLRVSGGSVHLACFCLLLGTQLWTTVPGGLALITSLSRHMFGKVQSALFPVYFALLTMLSAILLFSYISMHPYSSWTRSDLIQVSALGVTLATSWLSLYHVTPYVLRLMEEMYKVEKDEGSGWEVGMKLPEKLRQNQTHQKIHKRFMKAHGLSSLINIAGVIGTLVHLYYLASEMGKVEVVS